MEKISIKLPYVQEEIYIGNNIASFTAKEIAKKEYEKIIIIVDVNALKYNSELIKKITEKNNVVDKIIVAPISRYKNYHEAAILINKLVKNRLIRKSCLVAIGGGYVADMAGFVASIYMRGIDFIQVSTTSMAMSDAVIGKIAVNFSGYKNIVGNFYSPRLVFCDLELLKTLDKKEFIYGGRYPKS